MGLGYESGARKMDVFHSFVERFVGALEDGSHPHRVTRGEFPLGSLATTDPQAALKDGRAALLNYGFHQHLSCGEMGSIEEDLRKLRQLQSRCFQVRQPGNVEIVEDLLVIQDECIAIIHSLWRSRFPTWFHLSMLAHERRGNHIDHLASLVLKTWSTCRDLGAGNLLDRIQDYQHWCCERAGAAAHQLMTPGVDGFMEHLQDRVCMMRGTERDRPFYNRRWKDFCKPKKSEESLLLGGVPAYVVPFRLPPLDDWLPTTLCLMGIIDRAPKQ